MHAHFWGWHDTVGLMPMPHRFRFFAPDNIAPELERDDVAAVLSIAAEGWSRLTDRSPRLAEIAATVHAEPQPLADALTATPLTFIAGDWKMGNLGHHPDGRTILLDWAYPGAAPGAWDLAWYLALNRARLPQSKEATIAAYRAALESRGVDTDAWFDRQVTLSLLGMAVCFGWEKALGDEDELQWWTDRADRGMRLVRP
jgi:thiamine kinase-like enzyme